MEVQYILPVAYEEPIASSEFATVFFYLHFYISTFIFKNQVLKNKEKRIVSKIIKMNHRLKAMIFLSRF